MATKDEIRDAEEKLARYEKYDRQMSRFGKYESKRTTEAREKLEELRAE